MTALTDDLVAYLTIDDRARAIGVTTYDTALPQDWVDKFMRQTKFNPVGQIVWAYAVDSMFGEPIAVTFEAQRVLKRWCVEQGFR